MSSLWNNLPANILEEIAVVRASLEINRHGKVLATRGNCETVLRNDPILKGKIRLNNWTGQTDIVGYVGWQRRSPPITDTDLNHLYLYFEKFYTLMNERHIQTAIDVVATDNAYHPIIEYIESVEWDGKERIDHALHHFLGAEDDKLTAECFRLFMYGALERLYKPGCKFESMLCIVGGQGIGKSSFFRFLALRDEWFSDDLKRIDDENVYRKIQGNWIIEMAEMVGTANAKSVEDIKSFLSRQSDNYKVPYERYSKDRPRQCVFVGTTNKVRFLPLDRSGNRRFLPILADKSKAEAHVLDDIEATREYMRQLWAEALHHYKAGDYTLRLSKEAEAIMNIRRKDFMAEDTETGVVREWLDRVKPEFVCTRMIYNEAFHEFGEPDRKAVASINEIMNNEIYDYIPGPQHRFMKYGQQRSWMRKPPEPASGMTEVPCDPVQTGFPEEWLEQPHCKRESVNESKKPV